MQGLQVEKPAALVVSGDSMKMAGLLLQQQWLRRLLRVQHEFTVNALITL